MWSFLSPQLELSDDKLTHLKNEKSPSAMRRRMTEARQSANVIMATASRTFHLVTRLSSYST